jgi:hypothetical protein
MVNLLNLKEIKCESSMVSHQNIVDFCNLCKQKSICDTLEVRDFSTDPDSNYYHGDLDDDSLYVVLDTFPNLTAISIDHGDITLATAGITQKLCTLPQLRKLRFDYTKIFSYAFIMNADYDLINEWLLCFPKSLEIMSVLNTVIFMVDSPENALILNSIRSRIVSRSYGILPNLKEIDITWCVQIIGHLT